MDSCHYWEDQHASHGSESINVSFFTHLNAMFNMYVNMLGYFGFDFFHMIMHLMIQMNATVISVILNPVIMNVKAYANDYKFVLLTSSVFEPSFLSPEFHHLKLTLKTMI